MGSWTAQRERLSESFGLKFTIARDGQPASFAEAIEAWRHDAEFREMFNDLLADTPFAAFRWETPGVTAASSSQPFEFVVLDSPGLAGRPDRHAFAEHFACAACSVVAFTNLGGDAMLIAPCPLVEPRIYGHLAAFVRLAPEQQRHELWQTVGREMAHRLGDKPVWLSTAGAGVSWLHVRLDDRPKYYGFAPYRRLAGL